MPGLNISADSIIALLIMLIIAMPFHEFAHAWTADRFGDDTPRQNGRLTLNPLAHLDPIGSLMLTISILSQSAGIGWAKPVPVNPYALGRKSSLALMWVSLAGPFSNFLLAVLAAIPLRVIIANPNLLEPNAIELVTKVFYDIMLINLGLMLFNLIPIAPLDGSKIAVAVLPDSWGQKIEQFSAVGPMILMAVIFLGPAVGIHLLDWIITPTMSKLVLLLLGM